MFLSAIKAGKIKENWMPYIECGECDYGTDFGVQDMEQHILDTHTGYTPEQAKSYAENWLEDAYDREEAANIERAEYFRIHGIDPEDIDRDQLE
jgi:hypothetical protein